MDAAKLGVHNQVMENIQNVWEKAMATCWAWCWMQRSKPVELSLDPLA